MTNLSNNKFEVTIRRCGVPSDEELVRCPGVPNTKRLHQGPVAVIECVEEIPCNVCEVSCPRGAIRIGKKITNLPMLDSQSCVGCGLCIPKCPGLAIFVVDQSGKDIDKVSIPYEFLPLPKPGQIVTALDRNGQPVCDARVERVNNDPRNDRTAVVTLLVPKGLGMKVRFFWLKGEEQDVQRE